ncbi:hypothetical protein HK104_008241, partial [Borealophlyctis nickersoniae]
MVSPESTVENGHPLDAPHRTSNKRQLGSTPFLTVFLPSVLSLALVFLISGVLVTKSSILPQVADNAPTGTAFSTSNAWSYLSNITQHPHPMNSRNNIDVRNFIIATLQGFQRTAAGNGLTLDLDTQDNVNFTATRDTMKGIHFYFEGLMESTNVLARLQGKNPNAGALLLSAHFDSVDASFGASDDGIGCAVFMEILRTLVSSKEPPEASVIFNFNNGEENGLLGAITFTQHPWWKDVKAFLNVDAVGTSGRAMATRATHHQILNAYIKNAPYPHANAISLDLWRSSLRLGETDHSIYAPFGRVAGIDFAVYEHHGFYHTSDDSIDHVEPEMLHQQGHNLLALLKVAATPSFLQSLTPNDALTRADLPFAHDIPGFPSVSMSLRSYVAMAGTVFFLSVIGCIGLCVAGGAKRSKRVGVMCGELVVISIFYFLLAAIAVVIIAKVNPAVAVGKVWHVYSAFMLLVLAVVIGSAGLWRWAGMRWVKGFGKARVDELQTLIEGHLAVLGWQTVMCGFAFGIALKDWGALYFFVWMALFRLIGVVLTAVYARFGRGRLLRKEQQYPADADARLSAPSILDAIVLFIIPIVTNLAPLLVILDITSILFRTAMPHSQHPTSPIPILLVYFIVAFFAFLPIIGAFPTLNLNIPFRRWVVLALSLASLALFIVSCTIFPYNHDTSNPATITTLHLDDSIYVGGQNVKKATEGIKGYNHVECMSGKECKIFENAGVHNVTAWIPTLEAGSGISNTSATANATLPAPATSTGANDTTPPSPSAAPVQKRSSSHISARDITL